MKMQLIRVKHFIHVSKHNFKKHWNKYGIKYIVIVIGGFIICNKNVNLQFQLMDSPVAFLHKAVKKDTQTVIKNNIPFSKGELKTDAVLVSKKTEPKKKTFQDYIETFSSLAQYEMKKNGIPASITLAQGLLETNGGKSDLANKHYNHFGIKCFSKKCKKGHCVNVNDDTHKDFFIKYKSVKDSYRAHSLFLKKKRYEKLFEYEITDYKSWARELKRAGYATDKKYADKLIRLIEKYELHKYDKLN